MSKAHSFSLTLFQDASGEVGQGQLDILDPELKALIFTIQALLFSSFFFEFGLECVVLRFHFSLAFEQFPSLSIPFSN